MKIFLGNSEKVLDYRTKSIYTRTMMKTIHTLSISPCQSLTTWPADYRSPKNENSGFIGSNGVCVS
jgi:hypothetical protein